MKKYNAFQLKLFMAVLMVFDHLVYVPGLLSPIGIEVFHLLTRCVSVFFAYMAIEGFVHTRNRLKYSGRLFLWAGIMFVGTSMINSLYGTKGVHISNNIFLTLAMGVLSLNIWYYPVKKVNINEKVMLGIKIVIGTLITFMGMLFTEGGLVVIPFMLICYGLNNKKRLRDVLLLAYGIFLFAISFQYVESWWMTIRMLMFNSDWFFVSVIPFMYLYNGERGPKNKFSKYFFYVFYPAHLWILSTIAYIIK